MMTERQIKAIKKKLAKEKVGLPKKVVFYYEKGTAICYPKKRMWVLKPIGKKETIHIIAEGNRIDVTKHKARHLLKFALIGMLRDDSDN